MYAIPLAIYNLTKTTVDFLMQELLKLVFEKKKKKKKRENKSEE